MTLAEYIEKHGRSAKRALHEATGLRWATIHDIARGASKPRPETAKAIEAATNGEVSALALLGLEETQATGTDG